MSVDLWMAFSVRWRTWESGDCKYWLELSCQGATTCTYSILHGIAERVSQMPVDLIDKLGTKDLV